MDIIFAIKNVGWLPQFSQFTLPWCLLPLMVPQHLHRLLQIEYVTQVYLGLSCFISLFRVFPQDKNSFHNLEKQGSEAEQRINKGRASVLGRGWL